MTLATRLQLAGLAALIFGALDAVFLGGLAGGLYSREMGALMRPDVQFAPALAFYAIYALAIVELCVRPALATPERSGAWKKGAMLGLAAYAAYDLTGLSVIAGFPLRVALIDLAWGTTATSLAAEITARLMRRRAVSGA